MSQETPESGATLPRARPFLGEVKAIFIEWEKRRILYNAILFAVLMGTIISTGAFQNLSSWHPLTLGIWLLEGVIANLCFMAGPIADSYLAWLAIRHPGLSWGIFFLGVLVSIPLVIACANAPFGIF